MARSMADTTPRTWSSSSTTGTAVTPRSRSNRATWVTGVSGRTRATAVVMTSPTMVCMLITLPATFLRSCRVGPVGCERSRHRCLGANRSRPVRSGPAACRFGRLLSGRCFVAEVVVVEGQVAVDTDHTDNRSGQLSQCHHLAAAGERPGHGHHAALDFHCRRGALGSQQLGDDVVQQLEADLLVSAAKDLEDVGAGDDAGQHAGPVHDRELMDFAGVHAPGGLGDVFLWVGGSPPARS